MLALWVSRLIRGVELGFDAALNFYTRLSRNIRLSRIQRAGALTPNYEFWIPRFEGESKQTELRDDTSRQDTYSSRRPTSEHDSPPPKPTALRWRALHLHRQTPT